ncbi:MAG TPA: flagellar motor switch protein FliN [Terriglobales bacterium]|nr:flagellar motor switch protein FliN [Terriglobales bacterium]
MTDETSSPPGSDAVPAKEAGAGEFIRTWAENMARVLGQVAGSPLAIESLPAAPPAAPPREDNDLQVIVVAAGALRGEMSLRIPRASALALAQIFVGEPPAPAAEFKPEHREAVEELLRQIAGYVATALKPRWGDVQLRLDSGPPPSWSAGASGWLASSGEAPVAIEWQLSAALNAALLAAPPPAPDEPGEPQREAPEINSHENASVVEGNLDLLMDVELEVMLRFGERSMLLREILELGAGAVVELDRRVDEPTELLLDGRVIARGEVVVVDGNYGLRVLEVLPRHLAG